MGMTEVARLPGPVMELWEWQYEGSCRDIDDTLFFHPEGERGAAREAREQAARAICARCPVVRQCAEHALAVREPYGICGDLTEENREQIWAMTRRTDKAS